MLSPKTKYFIQTVAVLVIITASVILFSLGFQQPIGATIAVAAPAAESTGFSTPPMSDYTAQNSPKVVEYLPLCVLVADYSNKYGNDGLVKNGHQVLRGDLYTRHLDCYTEIPTVIVVQQVQADTHRKHHKTDSSVVPTPKPQLPPEPNPHKDDDGSSSKDNPHKSCHNKNDGKDGKIGDCDAGAGNNSKNKSK